MKDPKELFQKIYIKSETDLPTKECFIITKPKIDNGHLLPWRWFRVEDKKWWVDNIDWYFMPYKDSQCHLK